MREQGLWYFYLVTYCIRPPKIDCKLLLTRSRQNDKLMPRVVADALWISHVFPCRDWSPQICIGFCLLLILYTIYQSMPMISHLNSESEDNAYRFLLKNLGRHFIVFKLALIMCKLNIPWGKSLKKMVYSLLDLLYLLSLIFSIEKGKLICETSGVY